ncbi:MAG: gamma-glutamyl-gamma-aminobutyrate hydrolase family protein [Burkholderiales bacterium]
MSPTTTSATLTRCRSCRGQGSPGSTQARRARVNSIHHQSIKALGRGLSIEARAEPDGVIEAIRHGEKRYVFATQWHPEFHGPRDESLLASAPILDEFLQAARER